jgi:hypothetical protein
MQIAKNAFAEYGYVLPSLLSYVVHVVVICRSGACVRERRC